MRIRIALTAIVTAIAVATGAAAISAAGDIGEAQQERADEYQAILSGEND